MIKTEIIKTKAEMPQNGPLYISRPKLTEKLNLCVKRRLTLVLAPAGYGKTATVAEWADRTGLICVWLSVDSRDNDPRIFWKHVWVSLSRIMPEAGDNSESDFFTEMLINTEAAIDTIISRLSVLAGDYALVIDDMHLVNNRLIFEGLEYFIKQLPQKLHLILIGRAEPEHGLASVELKSQLSRVDAGILRFSRQEIADYFAKREIILTSREVQELEKCTEGWPAALVSVAVSMEKGMPFFDTISGRGNALQSIDQFLTGEVLDTWSEEKREFAVETSILDTLNASLCSHVASTINGERLLAEMIKQNEFVVYRGGGNYGYHSLLKATLSKLLLKETPERVRALHISAAAWYEEHNLLQEATEHYLGGFCFEEAFRLIEKQLGELSLADDFNIGLSWLTRLPECIWIKSPKIPAFYAFYYAKSGQFDLSEEWIKKAYSTLEAMDDEGCRKDAGNVVDLILSYLLLRQGKIKELVNQVKAFKPDIQNRNRLTNYLDFNKSDVYFYRCPTGAVVNSLIARRDDIYDLYKRYKRMILKDPGYTQLALGEYFFENSRFEEAMPYLTKGLENARNSGCCGALVPVMVDIARIKKAQGDVPGAFKALEGCESSLKAGQAHWLGLLHAYHARLHLETGNKKLAEKWAEENGLNIYSEISDAGEFELLVYARLLIKKKRYEDARILLLRLLTCAESRGRIHSKVEILNLLSILCFRNGSSALSFGYLKESLTIGVAEGFLRSFLDEGKTLLEVLEDAVAFYNSSGALEDGIAGFAGDLIRQIKTEAGSSGVNSGDRIRKELTARELEVLALLYEADSNDDICLKLDIGLRTVKTHIGNIYAKLGVSNRMQCIKLVRECGMFES